MSSPDPKAAAKAAKLAKQGAAKLAKSSAKQAKLEEQEATKQAKRSAKQAKLEEQEAAAQAKRSAKQAKLEEREAAAQAKLEAKAARAEVEPEFSLTIDQLTAETGIPSRTIRFYQSSGVLPKPEKRGRVAYYGTAHIERLELIGQLQDRGLRMRAIKDLADRLDAGELVLDEWLGLEEQLQSAWIDDVAQVLDRRGIEALLGDRRPGFVAELTRAGLVEARSDGTYLVPSPGLLRVAARLDEAGIALEVAAGATQILQKHLSRAAAELASYFVQHVGDGFGRGDSVRGISDAFRELRAIGLESVRLLFAREMEQVLRGLVESGEAARIDKKRRRKRG